MLDFLPQKLYKTILKLGVNNVSEIRIRCGLPILVVLNGEKVLLEKEIYSKSDIEDIVLRLCNHSIYAFDEQIKQGFITTDNGVRIGLSGEFVVKDSTFYPLYFVFYEKSY